MKHHRFKKSQLGFWNFVVPAIAGLIGGAYSARRSESGQEEANEQNLAIAQQQMAFQERMSNTAYQRATADMQQAGLNPMLAYSQGGASAPSGASAVMQNPNAQSAGILSSTAGQIAQMYGTVQQAEQAKEAALLNEAMAAKVRSETIAHSINNARATADLQISQREADKRGHEASIAGSENRIRQMMQLAYENDPADANSAWAARTKFGAETRRAHADADRARTDSQKARYDRDISEYESVIRKYGIDEAKANSEWWKSVHALPHAVKFGIHTMRGAMGKH